MTYRFIEENRSEFPVRRMCSALHVARSGYTRWRLHRGCGERHRDAQQLLLYIRQAYERSDRTYGAPRITDELCDTGHLVGHNRVARIMRMNGIRPQTRKRFRVVTTVSNHDKTVAPNLLNRAFTVAKPNKVWVSDITYLKTASATVYLCAFIDLYSRIVVGWSMSTSADHRFVCEALTRAICRRSPEPGLIIHSDQGLQYASDAFRRLLNQQGVNQSMSRRGDCWDNAVAESFFATLKTERTHRCHYANLMEAERDIFKYIEIWYNRFRRHSSIGDIAPVVYETQTKLA